MVVSVSSAQFFQWFMVVSVSSVQFFQWIMAVSVSSVQFFSMVYGGLSEFSEQLEMVPGRGGVYYCDHSGSNWTCSSWGGFITATGRPVFVHFLY